MQSKLPPPDVYGFRTRLISSLIAAQCIYRDYAHHRGQGRYAHNGEPSLRCCLACVRSHQPCIGREFVACRLKGLGPKGSTGGLPQPLAHLQERNGRIRFCWATLTAEPLMKRVTKLLVFGAAGAVILCMPGESASAITAELAKKCRDMALKVYPYKLVGQPGPGNAQAQRSYFSECVAKEGKMPSEPTGADQNKSGSGQAPE